MDVIVYRLGDTLVDTGQSHMLRPLLNILASRPPRRILLTHYHEDHSGNAGALVARFHAKLMAPEGTMARVAAGFRIRPYQHYIWGRAKSAKSEALPPLVETNGFRLRPIHTPGHSRDHTAYLEESNGWLFSGDVYLGDRIKFFRADEEFGPQIASLKKLLTLDFDTLFCAHNPALDNGKKTPGSETRLSGGFLRPGQRPPGQGDGGKGHRCRPGSGAGPVGPVHHPGQCKLCQHGQGRPWGHAVLIRTGRVPGHRLDHQNPVSVIPCPGMPLAPLSAPWFNKCGPPHCGQLPAVFLSTPLRRVEFFFDCLQFVEQLF